MRIPAPDRFKLRHVFVFITAIFIGQQLCGTDIIFSILTVVFITLWATAFNVTGGLSYTSGAIIFFFGIFTVVLAVVFKVLFFEPAERNLQAPRDTMVCYCMSMAAMLVAAILSQGLRRRQPLLKDFDSLEALHVASIVSLFLGIAIVLFSGAGDVASGSFITAIRQINRFQWMSVLLATTYEIKKSNGRRSVNWMVVAGASFQTLFGVIYFSKEGMLIGPTAWFLAAVLQRYNFSKLQLIGSVLTAAFVVYYLVPYSQYVRVFTSASRSENLATAIKYLGNLNETRRLYYDVVADYDPDLGGHIFDQRQSFLDRAIIFAADDALIAYTDQGHTFGLTPTVMGYENVIPRVFWPDKPQIGIGNVYGHELGILAEGDSTTGISFSPTGDLYHQARWFGLLVVLPINFFIAFLVTDSLVGSARYAPWALVWILEESHSASEAGGGSAIYLFTYGVVSMLFLYWTLRIATPRIMSVLRRGRVSSNGGPGRVANLPGAGAGNTGFIR